MTRPSSVGIFAGTKAELIEQRRVAVLEREYARGLADGLHQAHETAAGAVSKAVEELAHLAEERINDLTRDASRLAVEIARTLLRREIDAGRYDIERIVRETLLASGTGRGACALHLNPADVERLKGVVFRAGTVLESDPDIPVGDVHVTTPRGLLVRDVEQALAAIAERFEGDVT